jgi:hypothetical protein
MNQQQQNKSVKSANTTPGEKSSRKPEKESKSSLVAPHLKNDPSAYRDATNTNPTSYH